MPRCDLLPSSRWNRNAYEVCHGPTYACKDTRAHPWVSLSLSHGRASPRPNAVKTAFCLVLFGRLLCPLSCRTILLGQAPFQILYGRTGVE